MKQLGPGCRERTVGSLHIKLNCNLEEQLGSLYKAMEGEATGRCHAGSEGDVPGLFVGSLGSRAGGLAGPARACDEAEGQSRCVLSSRPVAATEAVGPGVV